MLLNDLRYGLRLIFRRRRGLIGEDVWRRRFGAMPTVLGQHLFD